MDNEKIESLISQLRGVGLGDEEILDVFYAAFEKGKMDRKDLETLAESLGYELDDDFKDDKTPDPIENTGADDSAAANVTPTEAEDLKQIKPGESKEEFKDKVDEAKDDMEADEDDKAEEGEEKSDDDVEWDEAKKYFKL